MKKVSTIFSVLVIMLAITLVNINKATAQEFSGGLELGIPNGAWSDFVGLGIGVSARYEAPIQDKLNWTASAGYLSFSGKDYTYGSITIPGSSSGVIPIAAGVKYYFQESNAGFYGAADLGIWIGTASGASSQFGFAPGVGYRLEKFDFTFRFNAVSNSNYLGLRAAYVFGGK